jgi:hypothetical protein
VRMKRSCCTSPGSLEARFGAAETRQRDTTGPCLKTVALQRDGWHDHHRGGATHPSPRPRTFAASRGQLVLRMGRRPRVGCDSDSSARTTNVPRPGKTLKLAHLSSARRRLGVTPLGHAIECSPRGQASAADGRCALSGRPGQTTNTPGSASGAPVPLRSRGAA